MARVLEESYRIEELLSKSFNQTEGLCNLQLGGYYEFDGAPKTITMARFSIKERPGSSIEIYMPDLTIFNNAEHIYIAKVDQLELMARFENGKRYRPPDFGMQGEARKQTGLLISNVSDLVKRYDEIRRIVSKWPTYPKSINVVTDSGEAASLYLGMPRK